MARPSSLQLKFKQAIPGQEKNLENLFRSAFDPYVKLLGRSLSDNAYDWLPQSIASGKVWLVTLNQQIVGAIAIIPDEDYWSIDQIAVIPAQQGQGIGSWLLDQIETLACSQNITSLRLDTAKMMTDLIRLYQRHGFIIIDEGPPEHNKDCHTRVIMQKSLH